VLVHLYQKRAQREVAYITVKRASTNFDLKLHTNTVHQLHSPGHPSTAVSALSLQSARRSSSSAELLPKLQRDTVAKR
jgi:hypothetical protein